MAMSTMRSAFLKRALSSRIGCPRPSMAIPQKRNFASSSHHDDAYEMAKWEKITYMGIATCTILATYNLSKGHPHYEDPPPYPYLHIRNKEFPWGTFHSIEDLLKKQGPICVTLVIQGPLYSLALGLKTLHDRPDGLFETKRHSDH